MTSCCPNCTAGGKFWSFVAALKKEATDTAKKLVAIPEKKMLTAEAEAIYILGEKESAAELVS